MGELQRVYVHIGPPKSGTTFLQNVLFANKDTLAAADVVLPAQDWSAHRRACVRLMQRSAETPPTAAAGDAPRDPWDRLVAQARRSGAQTAVLTAEQLSVAEPHAIGALVESFAPAQIHVVYSARDLASVVPADWQTRLRNRKAPTWREFCDAARDPGGPHSLGGAFWQHQDPGLVLPRWLQHVPPQRVHVVTVPRSGSDPGLLWSRFCAVVGLDPAQYSLDVPRSNASLGGVEAEVLRRLTARVADRLSVPVYTDLVKIFVAREVLERREQSFRLVLPEAEHAWLDPRAEQAIAYLRSAGFAVEGDLAELTPLHRAAERAPDNVDEAEVASLLDELLAAAVLEMARRQGDIRWKGPRSVDVSDAGD